MTAAIVHGTYTGYRVCNGGGRNACDLCRSARAEQQAAYRARLAEKSPGPNDRLNAEPARLIVLELRHLGYSDPEICRLAGVYVNVPWRLRHGVAKFVTRETNERLEAARRYVLQHPNLRPRERRVPAGRTYQQVRSLMALGWPKAWIAQQLGYRHGQLPFNFTRPLVNARTAEKVQRLYDQISGTKGPSQAVAAYARSRGWHVPLAYDDDGNLVPGAVPDALTEARERRARRLERPRQVAALTAQGLSSAQIAEVLGITPRTVVRDRTRKDLAS